jgi:hypothetical protein
MPDIEVLNYDIRAPPISVLISEAWCFDIGVYPISESPISDHKTTISEFFQYRRYTSYISNLALFVQVGSLVGS